MEEAVGVGFQDGGRIPGAGVRGAREGAVGGEKEAALPKPSGFELGALRCRNCRQSMTAIIDRTNAMAARRCLRGEDFMT